MRSVAPPSAAGTAAMVGLSLIAAGLVWVSLGMILAGLTVLTVTALIASSG